MPHRTAALIVALVSFGAVAQPEVDPNDPAPEGYAWVQLAAVAAGSAVLDFNAGATPDLVAGDYLLMPTTTTPGGYAVTLFTDGHIEYSGGADESRQTLDGWAWDTSVGDWHADSFQFVANNIAPVGGDLIELELLADEAMAELDLNAIFTDGEDDVLTFALVSGALPTGLSLTDGVISGTPTVLDLIGVTVVYSADDGYGGSDTQELFFQVFYVLPDPDPVTVPDVVGEADFAAADTILESNDVDTGSTATRCSAVTADEIISQDPPAGTAVAPGSLVNLIASNGTPCTGRRNSRMGMGVGR